MLQLLFLLLFMSSSLCAVEKTIEQIINEPGRIKKLENKVSEGNKKAFEKIVAIAKDGKDFSQKIEAGFTLSHIFLKGLGGQKQSFEMTHRWWKKSAQRAFKKYGEKRSLNEYHEQALELGWVIIELCLNAIKSNYSEGRLSIAHMEEMCTLIGKHPKSVGKSYFKLAEYNALLYRRFGNKEFFDKAQSNYVQSGWWKYKKYEIERKQEELKQLQAEIEGNNYSQRMKSSDDTYYKDWREYINNQ